MSAISEISPLAFALIILISGTSFTCFWWLDSITHGKLAHNDITPQELTTHRIILATSLFMMTSLFLMYWFEPLILLPFFIAGFITRTAHETMDEIHFHINRCTPYESLLHLGMWLSILTNTTALFMWGFFTQYAGIESLSPILAFWALLIGISIIYISKQEWSR